MFVSMESMMNDQMGVGIDLNLCQFLCLNSIAIIKINSNWVRVIGARQVQMRMVNS